MTDKVRDKTDDLIDFYSKTVDNDDDDEDDDAVNDDWLAEDKIRRPQIAVKTPPPGLSLAKLYDDDMNDTLPNNVRIIRTSNGSTRLPNNNGNNNSNNDQNQAKQQQLQRKPNATDVQDFVAVDFVNRMCNVCDANAVFTSDTRLRRHCDSVAHQQRVQLFEAKTLANNAKLRALLANAKYVCR